MSYTVIANQITKSFGDRLVLDGVDLAVQTGSVFALLGPNGAGKSTLVRILSTLLTPDAGTAIVAGHDLRSQPGRVRRSISLTGQHTAVDEVLTGRENLEMMAELRHLPRQAARRRAVQLLAEFDLLDAGDRRVATYSGGMKRRLDLALSIIERPQLMFLDEPTAGLDPRSREQLWVTVRRIVDEGVTVLLTTQYLEEADQLADQVAMLDHGALVARGTPDELKASLGAEVVRLQFAGAAAYRAARTELDVAQTHDRPNTIEIATDGSAEQLLKVLQRLGSVGVPALKVSTHRPSLDDVFLALTAADAADDRVKEMIG
jgi:ABC-2 type transport system ATP-binding protein